MDELEIKIVLKYKVPENGLTVNGLLKGLEENKSLIMKALLKAIFQALEEKEIEKLKLKDQDRYVRNGHQRNERKLITSFGEIRYRLAQVYDKWERRDFSPLAKRLSFPAYKQYQGECLEDGIGLAIHLSYQQSSKEVSRIKGKCPSKSTLHRYMQDISRTCKRPSFKDKPFRFLLVDGTPVKIQNCGYSLGKQQMRWALASLGANEPFELVGFWVGKSWNFIRKELEERLNYEKLEILFSDGEPGIEENLLREGMRTQRCIFHFLIFFIEMELRKTKGF